MTWLRRPWPQLEWIQLASVPFYEKLMASKKTLNIARDSNSLCLWFKSGRYSCYSTIVKSGTWLPDFLGREFPKKMRGDSRFQTIAWKKLKALW
jgi:hypothetical protein